LDATVSGDALLFLCRATSNNWFRDSLSDRDLLPLLDTGSTTFLVEDTFDELETTEIRVDVFGLEMSAGNCLLSLAILWICRRLRGDFSVLVFVVTALGGSCFLSSSREALNARKAILDSSSTLSEDRAEVEPDAILSFSS
jgi:hypothetical protein